MSRKHSYRGQVLGAERRADHHGRRSARGLGVVVSLARMAELRVTIASTELPDAVRQVGRVGLSADAYAVDFNGVTLVAVYDRRSQSIATFLPPDAPEIIHTDVDVREPNGPESVVGADSGPALAR